MLGFAHPIEGWVADKQLSPVISRCTDCCPDPGVGGAFLRIPFGFAFEADRGSGGCIGGSLMISSVAILGLDGE